MGGITFGGSKPVGGFGGSGAIGGLGGNSASTGFVGLRSFRTFPLGSVRLIELFSQYRYKFTSRAAKPIGSVCMNLPISAL